MGLTNLSTKRQRIAELARSKRGVALSTLHHVIDLEWMKEAYRLTRKDGAPGIDGVTATEYAENLEANLLDLLDRINNGEKSCSIVFSPRVNTWRNSEEVELRVRDIALAGDPPVRC